MFQFLGITIHLYGVCIALGVLAAIHVSTYIAKQSKLDENLFWDPFAWVLLGGLAGARIYHVVDLWSYYSVHPTEIVAVWQGGLGIWGALIGGVVAFWIYAGIKKILPELRRKIFDIVAIGIPLGQAIGRWGNYFNQELYGVPTDLPWGIYIEPRFRLAGFENHQRFHPLFLYESLLNLGLFLILYRLYASKIRSIGSLFFVGVYLIGYSLIRFSLEFIRLEKWYVGSVPTAQLLAGILFVCGVGLILRSHAGKLSNRS